MNKKIILSTMAIASILTACDDDYMKQFDAQEGTITDVKSLSMTLENGDYKSIASNATNQAKALELDPENKTYVTKLNDIGKNYYFTDEIAPEDYIPAYLDAKYPNADLGSTFAVTYKQYRTPSTYMSDFTSMTSYQLTQADYDGVWGSKVKASYLTPQSKDQIPGILLNADKEAVNGDMCVVNYAYSDVEPSIGGGSGESYVYKKVSSFAGAGTYILASEVDGNYIPWGYLASTVTKTYGYFVGDALSASDDAISADDGDAWSVTAETAEGGFSLKNTKGQYPYCSGTYNSYNIATALPATGGIWTLTPNGDGTFKVANTLNNFVCKYTPSYKSFGVYPGSKYGEYLNDPLAGSKAEGFTIQDVNLPEGLTYVWQLNSTYGFKGSAYANGTNYEADSWVVSPAISISSTAVSPVFSADVAARYFSTSASEALEFAVSEDYVDDVTTCTWTPLDVQNWTDGTSWNYVNTGDIDLSAYKGKTIRIAMKYTSTVKAATVEVKNFKVADTGAASSYLDLCVFQKMTSAEAAAYTASAKSRFGRFLAASTSGVQPNAAAIYKFNGTSWSEYSNSDTQVAVLSQKDYDELGSLTVGDPVTALPIYLSKKFPYLVDDATAVVVYTNSKNALVAEEYEVKDGIWSAVTDYTTETMTFSKDQDGINANVSSFLESTFLGVDGGFTAQNVSMSGSLSYVWANNSTYGWKASAYANKTNNPAESYLVSPVINIKKAKNPVLCFDEVYRYITEGQPSDYLKVLVTTNYTGDPATTSWEELTIPTWSTGEDWTYVNTGYMDLAAYKGNTIVIAFKYVSTEAMAPTWEIKNFQVIERPAEEAAE